MPGGLVQCPTPDFGSGPDFGVEELSPRLGSRLSGKSAVPSLSAPPPSVLSCVRSLSLSLKYIILKENKELTSQQQQSKTKKELDASLTEPLRCPSFPDF